MYRLFFLFWLSTIDLVTAQVAEHLGVPLIKHYNTYEMGFNKKTWSISQSPSGFLYFANGKSILEYDGERWKKTVISDVKANRSLFAHTNDSIYVGMDGDYGVLKRQNNGMFDYTSMFSFNDGEAAVVEEFWKLHRYKKYYIFQTFRNLYVYNGKLTTKISAPYRFKWSNMLDGEFYVNDVKYGLFKFLGTNLKPVINDPKLNDKIVGITKVGNHKIVLTTTDGLHKLQNDRLIKWDIPVTEAIEQAQIFSFLRLQNGDLAIGTVSDGLYILDKNGNLKTHLNKSGGLQNNTVLTVFEDNENNLWLGLDFGIDYVKINSNIAYKFDYKGEFGSTYAARIYENQLYLGTNQGLYVVEEKKVESLQKFTSLLGGQVWNIQEIDNTLFIGHDTGAYTYDGERLEQIGEEPGAWNFRKIDDTYLVSGNYNGISIYKRNSLGKWEFHKVVNDYKETGRFVEIDDQKHVWTSLNTDGLYRLKIDFERGTLEENKFFAIKDLKLEKVFITKYDEDVAILGAGSVRKYSTASSTFEPVAKDTLVPQFANMLQPLDGRTWYMSNEQIAVAEGGTLYELGDLKNQLIVDVLKVFPLTEDRTLVPIYNGFATYTSTQNRPSNQELKPVQIRSIQSINHSEFYDRNNTISYEDNDVVISYAQPTFATVTQYQTRLDEGAWSSWQRKPQSTILNLREGTHQFEVKAKSGDQISTDSITFKIDPPWYRSALAYILYFALLILLILLLVYINKYRLKKQEQKLSQKRKQSLKEQEQRFLFEQKEQQRRIVELENSKLQEEIQNKSRELTQVAHVNMNKNKILGKIKEKLIDVQDKANQKLGTSSYTELKRYIEQHITDKENQLFTINFDKSHQDFYSKLSEKYPGLTSKDLRLCAYLRINLSSKEIAPLLGISSQSVDVSRHRLRKKMNLQSKDNLTAILASFSHIEGTVSKDSQ